MAEIFRGTYPMYYGASKLIRERAKELRLNLTPEEELLWNEISKKQLGARFRKQHPIHTYIADFFCPELKLVIEVDGRIHLGKDQAQYDLDRNSVLSEFGITTVRFTNSEINQNLQKVLEFISTLVKKLREDPSQG